MTADRWRLPDWRTGAYPDLDAPPHRWAWEFLRRRDDYRAAWIRCSHRAETLSNDLQIAMADDHKLSRRRYGMSRLIHPSSAPSDWQLAQMIRTKTGGHGVGYRSKDDVEEDEAEHLKAIAFDISKPIAPQIEDARRYLERIQREMTIAPSSPKNRIRNWPTFLRVLDARDAGATFDQIAETLWPGQDKTAPSARDALTAAQAVQKRAPFLL